MESSTPSSHSTAASAQPWLYQPESAPSRAPSAVDNRATATPISNAVCTL
jgi:hypothetical protein